MDFPVAQLQQLIQLIGEADNINGIRKGYADDAAPLFAGSDVFCTKVPVTHILH